MRIETMSRNTEVIQTFVDTMNRHDIDGLLACYAPDARIIYPGRAAQAPKEQLEGERAMLQAVPNYAIEATSLLDAAGDHVLLELRMTGTQRPDLGGRSFEITGAYVFRLENGLIVEERAYPDTAGLRRQLAPKTG
jgi:ketosteroid isomerase-like protein